MNNLLVFFDTETTGLIEWKIPSDDPIQPHVVQLAAIVVDEITRKTVHGMEVIVSPDGWDIPQDVVDIHGITSEYAKRVGIPEQKAVALFLSLWNHNKRIAYNTTFDNRIIRIALKRYFSEKAMDSWKTTKYECAMIKAQKAMGGQRKKLVVAYEHYFGKPFENAHSAMDDVIATKDLYFAIQDKQVLEQNN